jgi:hypothetical protein
MNAQRICIVIATDYLENCILAYAVEIRVTVALPWKLTDGAACKLNQLIGVSLAIKEVSILRIHLTFAGNSLLLA